MGSSGRRDPTTTRRGDGREESAQTSRRALLVGVGGFVAGAAATVATGYLTDYLKVAVPPGEEADRRSGDEAIRAVVLRERSLSSHGARWVLPYRASTRPEVEEVLTGEVAPQDGLDRFLYRNGAIDPGVTSLKLVVEGRRHSGTRVVGLKAKIHRRAAPLSGGTLLLPGPQGAGESGEVGIDLDSPDLLARAMRPEQHADALGDEEPLHPYFEETTVGLNRVEQFVFQITAHTQRHYVEWYLELTVLDDMVERVYQIGINDTPFKTTALHDNGTADSYPSQYAEVFMQREFLGSPDAPDQPSGTYVRVK